MKRNYCMFRYADQCGSVTGSVAALVFLDLIIHKRKSVKLSITIILHWEDLTNKFRDSYVFVKLFNLL